MEKAYPYVLKTSSISFDASHLPFDVERSAWSVIPEGRLHSLLLAHILSTKTHLPSEDGQKKVSSSHSYRMESSYNNKEVHVQVGLGQYFFTDFEGNELFAMIHTVGEPVGTGCGVALLEELILFAINAEEEEDGKKRLVAFLTALLLKNAEPTEENSFTIYNWDLSREYWRMEAEPVARPLASVILPQKLKDRLLNDMTNFLGPKTATFFKSHGIPYRRSYLFYGTPGSGKTSLVQALAGHFMRSVCFLQPTHPSINDDSLRRAVQEAPPDSIIVLEDIDALFDKDRSAKTNTPLTFSGLLNALDGVGSPSGQVFILTTNLRDNLDPALIRNGRVDMHIEFTDATEEQMQLIWNAYYPDHVEKAEAFSAAVKASLGDIKVSTALLQHFFVTQMHTSAEDALANVGQILEELRLRQKDTGDVPVETYSELPSSESSEGANRNYSEEEKRTDEESSVSGDVEKMIKVEENKKHRYGGDIHVHIH